MKEDFDFDRVGKRLPYTAPDGFLDDMENNVWETVKLEMLPSKPKRNFRLWYSVTGGLVDVPVIAVPTSIGYGASFNGLAALLSMLNSCANGISVVNIDNGFGAAYTASMINRGKYE